jgi:hypothetical protein
MNLSIVKLLLSNRETHSRYGKFVKECVDQEDSKELKLILNSIDRLYDEHDADRYTVDDLDIMLSKAYPNQPKTLLTPILERLKGESANPALLNGYLRDLQTRKEAHQIAVQALKVYETGEGTEELLSRLTSLQESGDILEGDKEDDEFVSNNIAELLTELEQEPGLNWRLKTLNEMFGPLRKGNFGFLFARPESGKTTFLASETSFMLEQLDRALLWVNNEEESRKVVQRVVQASLGVTDEQLMHNKERCNELFQKRTGGRFKINKGGATTKRQIEQWCKQLNPGLIVLDQIDKIQGFEDERHDLKMKQVYAWARELAKQYGPVIAVCQAGGTGENKKWLTMNDVDSSHTSKQGEADFILGIGKLHDEQYERVRFLHASKNKLTGQHSKKEVLINVALARYEDIQR